MAQHAAEQQQSRAARPPSSAAARDDYDVPARYANLDEVAGPSPVENPAEAAVYRHQSLEQARSQAEAKEQQGAAAGARRQLPDNQQSGAFMVSRLATQLYTVSYLVLFSLLGTLARLGLQALTASYPGAPAAFASLWPNFAGCVVMGFLAEDRALFRHEYGGGVPIHAEAVRKAGEQQQQQQQQTRRDEESGSSGDGSSAASDAAAAKKAHAAAKKTIPLYIGLATGFCGSFTSFSSFVRDAFLALSNDLPVPGSPGRSATPRNGGYSFMAVVAVILLTVSVSLAGLLAGAHLALAAAPLVPALPPRLVRRGLDRAAVALGWGCWAGAVLIAALPPDRDSGRTETWRGRAAFALVFAPLGCLARFYASLRLNGRAASFPLGTFAVNVFGAAILAVAWDLAHVPLGGVVGCQVLQGVEDGFCGCLTTVSTWAAELAALRRRHAYVYGAASVLVALALMVAIMGGLRWSDGFAELRCVH